MHAFTRNALDMRSAYDLFADNRVKLQQHIYDMINISTL